MVFNLGSEWEVLPDLLVPDLESNLRTKDSNSIYLLEKMENSHRIQRGLRLSGAGLHEEGIARSGASEAGTNRLECRLRLVRVRLCLRVILHLLWVVVAAREPLVQRQLIQERVRLLGYCT